ncbi:MAG: EscI/YscI/HrpB family type III secretion system inner rod protein [Pseudomonadota bacterium]
MLAEGITFIPADNFKIADQALDNPQMAAEFDQLMLNPTTEVMPAGQIDSDQIRVGQSNSLQAETSTTIGEKLFQGVGEVKERMDSKFETVAEKVNHVEPGDVKGLLEVQYEMSMFHFEVDLYGKITGESVQNVDKFLSQQ